MDIQTLRDFHRSINDIFKDFASPWSNEFPSSRASLLPATSGTTLLPSTTTSLRPLSQSYGRGLGRMQCDIVEKDNEYNVQVDIPGVKKEDVSVSVDNGMLQINAERREQAKERGDTWVRRERQYGKTYRSLPVPEDADVDKVSAKFENGELCVTVPKIPGMKKSQKQIAIQ